MSILLSILPAFAFEAQDSRSRTKAPAGQSRSKKALPAMAAAPPKVEAAAPSTNHHAWHMKMAEIKDLVGDPNAGKERQLTAMSMLIPTGWTLHGRPEYPATADCNFTNGRIGFRANSPDGLKGIRVIPMSAGVWSDNRVVLQQIQRQNKIMKLQQIRIEPPKQISQTLLEAASRLLAGSHVEQRPEPVPEMTGQLQPALDQINLRLSQAAAAGMPAARVSAKAARVKVSWMLNGKPIEAWIVALQTVKTEPLPIGGKLITNDVPLLSILHAPQGQIDQEEKMLIAMLGSAKLHPEWQEELSQVNFRRIQAILDDKLSLNQIYTEMAQDNLRTQQKIAAIQADVQQFSPYMGDQVIYRNPSTGERVQMSSQAGHAWTSSTSNTNEYILTDSPSYNPNGRVGSGSWIELTVER